MSKKMNSDNFRAVEDKKREYLIKTLSRTKRKDYENYIVNAIYHKLDRLDIQPVTQQYIKRSDGRYALIDLYFPQINYGIECDEAYHCRNQEHDELRQLTMKEMLDSVEETQGFILRRVRAYEDLTSIDNQIKEIVNEIHSLLEQNQIKYWDIDFDSVEYAIERRKISIEDRLEFDLITTIARCFGREYKGYQKSSINVGFGYFVWCTQLAIMIDGKAKSAAKGWINTLSQDWDYIYEENPLKNDISYAVGDKDQCRIIFAKSKNNLGIICYRFIGVFKYDETHSTKLKNAYRRVATEIKLDSWLNN